MGSCVSICKSPKRNPGKKISPQENLDSSSHVQDKLVIVQAPKILSPLPPNSPTTSSSSASSFTGSGTISGSDTTSSSSSSSSASTKTSSSSGLKDRTFSNEFLRACAKENPQIIGRVPVKGSPARIASPKLRPRNLDSPSKLGKLKPAEQPVSVPPLQKQRSFRKEPERVSCIERHSSPGRALGSPSPSRRFGGDKSRGIQNRGMPRNRAAEGYSKTYKPLAGSDSTKTLRRMSNSPARNQLCLRRGCVAHRIGTKYDEIDGSEEGLEHQQEDSVFTEDIDNPLISLDCFIFL